MTVIPAYGRDYKSDKAVKADWAAGKDFVITGIYEPSDCLINIEDAKKFNVKDEIWVRYKRLEEIVKVYP